jgi:hypothetical protein
MKLTSEQKGILKRKLTKDVYEIQERIREDLNLMVSEAPLDKEIEEFLAVCNNLSPNLK